MGRPITTVRRRRNPFAVLWLPVVAAAFLGYFGYNAFTGDFGIWSMDRLKAEQADLSAQLAGLKAEHAALEAKVARMRPETLDADLVDSSARSALSLMRPDEVVLGTPLPLTP